MSVSRAQQLQLIVTIVERGNGNKVARLFKDHQVAHHLQCEGVGTATSDILDILGIGSSEKDILLSIAPQATAQRLFEQLNDELHDVICARGISFTVPMNAVSNRLSTAILLRTKPEKESGGEEMQQAKNSLILAIVNRGYTDVVMASAKRAGARGGTIIRARWSGEEQMEQLSGFSLQAEKEIVAIVSPSEIRNQIMEAIHQEHGVQTEAGAALCSLPIEQMIHIG